MTPATPSALGVPGAQGNFGGNAGGGNNVTIMSDARANPDTNANAAEQSSEMEKSEDVAQAQEALQSEAPAASGEGVGVGGGAGGADLAHEEANAPVDSMYKTLTLAGNTAYSRGAVEGPVQLQTANAISLPVDFPVDGLQVYHFKKLKSNARLTFWITNGEGLDKWKWLAVFALAALAIYGVCKIVDRGLLRVLRRRVVHI